MKHLRFVFAAVVLLATVGCHYSSPPIETVIGFEPGPSETSLGQRLPPADAGRLSVRGGEPTGRPEPRVDGQGLDGVTTRPTRLDAPTSRAGASGYPEADDIAARRLTPDWPADAPGEQVVPAKLLPIDRAAYRPAAQLTHPVDDDDLVIGVARGGHAYAWPIKMLGGPTREIINHRLQDEPFAVNW